MYLTGDHRVLREIRVDITKRCKWIAVSRLFAKNDKEKIASWISDLKRILIVFNVRSITSARASLTTHSQVELLIS